MKKKTNIFGFDRTPRRMLWAEINQLVKQVENQERHSIDQQRVIDQLKKALARSEASRISAETAVGNAKLKIDRKNREIDNLRARLARYDRPKDEHGRFTKQK